MTDEIQQDIEAQEKVITKVGYKETRKIRARRTRKRSVWSGLGTMGMIGWSVIIPILIGIALGAWLDDRLDDPFPWTLALLFLGLVLGCSTAWYWVSSEQKGIERERESRKRD
jgi:ATP synthase protein I